MNKISLVNFWVICTDFSEFKDFFIFNTMIFRRYFFKFVNAEDIYLATGMPGNGAQNFLRIPLT
jgi:hypothetical protein